MPFPFVWNLPKLASDYTKAKIESATAQAIADKQPKVTTTPKVSNKSGVTTNNTVNKKTVDNVNTVSNNVEPAQNSSPVITDTRSVPDGDIAKKVSTGFNLENQAKNVRDSDLGKFEKMSFIDQGKRGMGRDYGESGYEDLDKIEADFVNYQQEQIEKQKQLQRNSLGRVAAFSPYLAKDENWFNDQANSIDNIDNLSSIGNEVKRRSQDEQGNWGIGLGSILNFTSQEKTPEAARKIYEYHMAAEQPNNNPAVKTPTNSEYFTTSDFDNGQDPNDSREGSYMTGEQYLKYESWGIPGRDPAHIDPKGIYSKQAEQDKYGFIPYIVSDDAFERFHTLASRDKQNDAFAYFSDLRRNLTNYDINYNDKVIDGKDFDKYYDLYSRRVNPELKSGTEGMDQYDTPVGLYYMKDGNKVWVTNEDTPYQRNGEAYLDDNTKLSQGYIDPSKDKNARAFGYIDAEPYRLSDGTALKFTDVVDIRQNNDKYTQFAPNGINNPNTPEDPFSSDRVLPYVIDLFTQSAPLFHPVPATLQAMSNGTSGAGGWRYARTPDGRLEMLSEDPTTQEMLTSGLGSAIMPLTERLFGHGIQHGFFSPLRNTITKNRKYLEKNPVFNYLMNTTGEAAEEVPGNIVEEMISNPNFGNMFANKKYIDKNGAETSYEYDPVTHEKNAPKIDSMGNIVYDEDTPFINRVGNFAKDIPSALLGGGVLGGIIGLPKMAASVPGYLNSNDRAERKERGYNIELPSDQETMDMINEILSRQNSSDVAERMRRSSSGRD